MSQVLSQDVIIGIAKSALKGELQTASIYNKLSDKFSGDIAGKLMHFAEAEHGHASFWRDFIVKRGVDPNTIEISRLKISILAFFYGLLGVGLTLKILEAGERKAISDYSRMLRSQHLTDQEKESITLFLLAELAHEEEFLEYEVRYRFFINKIATIFTQTSGGLVIVISTAIGLASVYDNPLLIGLTGLIVGLTGAMNTVVGFYFFGRTSRRIKEDILLRIRMTSECAPQAYLRRIEKYMRAKDYSEDVALRIAEEAGEKRMIERIIAEEEYGISEGALGNPLESALYAGFFKIIGTLLPLLPFFAGLPVNQAIPISILITLTLLSIAGALTAIAAEVDVKSKVFELTTGGLVLSMLTYVLGKLASIIISILKLR